jgi:UDP-N-acetylmuramyl tripeptide synthase
MRVVEQRFLRGPNLYAMQPCLMTVLDTDNAAGLSGVVPVSELHVRLVRLLPGLEEHVSGAQSRAVLRRLREGRPVSSAHVAALVQRELQRLAGAAPSFDRVRPVRAVPGRYRLVSGYGREALAEGALRLALTLLAALTEGAHYELAEPLAALRDDAGRRAWSPAMRDVLDAARRTETPVLRVDDDSMQIQLGWGSKQRRLRAESDTAAGGAEASKPEIGGRIPVIAVTGTNGKTTPALMLALGVAQAGLRCGLTTTEGVYIDGVRTFKGDCSGYWSARRVLASPDVDVAVLETARGGMLKRGLAFDRCDVGVVLNVSADHLGLDGIDTVRDLARVKGLVARVSSRAVVLNAEDPYCVAMAGQLAPGVEVLYFSLDAEHPVLLRHLHAGGRAAYLQDGMLVLADGARRHALLPAAAMPAALGGHARYNIANGLAAAAALEANGFAPALTAAALGSFVSDSQTNPLRSNVFALPGGGATLIVDYAHNPAAYAALGETARAMARGRVLGVVTAPGDRRDADLREVGAVCGSYFDALAVYESARRGRERGEAGRLITAGIADVADTETAWRQIDDVREALAYMLGQCAEGDVLVYSCPSSLDTLVDVLRGADPAAAELVAAEAGLEVAATASA